MFFRKENNIMIMDALSRWSNYHWLNERFGESFRFLEGLNPDAPEGRTDIDGEDIFCMVQSYETRVREGQQFEAHRQYADIQMALDGEESILWAPVDTLTVRVPYKHDIAFYDLTPAPTELVLTPGVFCVLFPPDAHAPCLQHGRPSTVRKAVVKVRIA
jgi:biofilm protein TabA